MQKYNWEKSKEKLQSLFKGGFFHILTGNFMNKALSMISSIVIVRIVDKSIYANISYADNLYTYIALASGLGMSLALLKFCSNDQSKDVDKAFLNYALKIGCSVDLIISAILCICTTLLDIPYPNARVFIWSLMFYPFFEVLVNTISVYMRTQMENKKYAFIGIMKAFCLCVFTIVFVLVFGTHGIIGARYLTILVVLFYSLNYVKGALKDSGTYKLSNKQKKEFFLMGLSLCIANFFSGIMPINEAFLVNNLIKNEVVTANFKVAGLLPQMLLLVSGAITVYYFPIVARLESGKDIKKKVIEIALINAIIIIALTVIGMIMTPIIIWLLYGEKYMDAVSVSYLLWIMRASNCVIRIVPINILPAIGKTKFNLFISICSCVMQCIIDYLCITKYGINGVAIGATIVYVISGVLYWLYFIRCCKKFENASSSL